MEQPLKIKLSNLAHDELMKMLNHEESYTGIRLCM